MDTQTDRQSDFLGFLSKPKRKIHSEPIEMFIPSNHIIFKKKNRDLMKNDMNLKLSQKDKIFKEFEQIATTTTTGVDKGK